MRALLTIFSLLLVLLVGCASTGNAVGLAKESPVSPVCGNGVIEPGERCDIGRSGAKTQAAPYCRNCQFTAQTSPDIYLLPVNDSVIALTYVDGPVWLFQEFYRLYPDEYDLISFHFLNGLPGSSTYAVMANGDFASGALTQPPSPNVYIPSLGVTMPRAEAFGSERVIGGYIEAFPFTTQWMTPITNNIPTKRINKMYFELMMHEITHLWGVVLLPTELQDALVFNGANFEQGHFEFFTGSWVSVNSDPLVRFSRDTQPGRYRFDVRCGMPMHDQYLLYSMGAIGAQEVTDPLILTNRSGIQFSNRCDTSTLVPDGTIRRVMGIEEFVEVLGPRDPPVGEADVTFDMAFVLVVAPNATVTTAHVRALDWLATAFPIAWYRSTGGRSTINDAVPVDTVPPQITLTANDGTIAWTTSEPTVSFFVYDSAAGHLVSPSTVRPYQYRTSYSYAIPGDAIRVVRIVAVDRSFNLATVDVS